MVLSGPRPRGVETRERILDTAAVMFVKRGYAATSIRDIAGSLGISNPALYHHFASKSDILMALLAEPMARVQTAIVEARQLDGDDRARRLVRGLLEALEVHSGIAVAATRESGSFAELRDSGAVQQTQPAVALLLAEVAAEDNREIRVRMAMAAVEGAVVGLFGEVETGEEFTARLRQERDAITELALRLLR